MNSNGERLVSKITTLNHCFQADRKFKYEERFNELQQSLHAKYLEINMGVDF